MGCWLLTEADAAITPKEGPAVVLIGCAAGLFSVGILLLTAFLQDKNAGTLAVTNRSLFFSGCCGVLVDLFFVFTSRGTILQFGPVPGVLSGVFVLLILAFGPILRRKAGPRQVF